MAKTEPKKLYSPAQGPAAKMRKKEGRNGRMCSVWSVHGDPGYVHIFASGPPTQSISTGCFL